MPGTGSAVPGRSCHGFSGTHVTVPGTGSAVPGRSCHGFSGTHVTVPGTGSAVPVRSCHGFFGTHVTVPGTPEAVTESVDETFSGVPGTGSRYSGWFISTVMKRLRTPTLAVARDIARAT